MSSVARQADCKLLSFARPRFTFSRMSFSFGCSDEQRSPSSARAEIGDERGVRSMEDNPFLRGPWCVGTERLGTERLGEWALTF